MGPDPMGHRAGCNSWQTSRTRKRQGILLYRFQKKQSPVGTGHLDFRLLASRTVKQYFSRFKPPSLWYFVIAKSQEMNTLRYPSVSSKSCIS
jgi:hypothetical protein